jgi:hypothetical protein
MPPPDQTTSEKSSVCSSGMEDTLSEEVQLGSSVHLAFEELRPRHVPLRWPVTVLKNDTQTQ